MIGGSFACIRRLVLLGVGALLIVGCGASPRIGAVAVDRPTPQATPTHDHAARPTPLLAASDPPRHDQTAVLLTDQPRTTTAIELGGSGQQASDHITLVPGLVRVRYNHPAATPFAMFLMNEAGDHLALIANGAQISGTQIYGIAHPGTYYLHVIAEDRWNVQIDQPPAADLIDQADAVQPLAGHGPLVSAPMRLEAGTRSIRWTHAGHLPFEIVLWDARGQQRIDAVLASTAAAGTATINVPVAGTYLFNILGDGAWTIAPADR